MPETMFSQPPEREAVARPSADRRAPGVRPADLPREFDYRPLPVLAPASVFVGVASFTALMGLFGLFIALTGMVLGLVALFQIARSRGEYGGRWLALTGLGLSSVLFFSGSGLLYYDYVTELPEGYRRVHFPRDISAKKFVIENGAIRIHPDVAPLESQKVFLKGWIWTTNVAQDFSQFILLKDNGECCFGGDPAFWDFIDVRLQDGLRLDYVEGLVAIGGVLRINPDGPARQEALYVLEADYIARPRTSF